VNVSTLRWMVLGGALAAAGTPLLSAQRTPLRVCADPDYLPFSNRAGEGFENKIADAVAKALGQTVQYTWANSRGRGGFPEFLSLTLDAKKCDVVMGIPYGNREELTTQPYYVSSRTTTFGAWTRRCSGSSRSVLKAIRRLRTA